MKGLKEKAILQEWQFRDATQQELLKFKQQLRPILKNLSSEKLRILEKRF